MLRFRALWAPVSLLCLFQFSGNAQNYTISTIAGLRSNFGHGVPAINARFGIVSAVAAGPDGSVYVADAAYHQVFRVGRNGNISVFAGSRTRGFGGDFGPATAAMLDTPTALAVDLGGAVFIGDSGNHRVRVVSVYGNISTVAGNGQIAPSPALAPVLPGIGGPATAAPLNQIAGLAFASNSDQLIADSGNNRIFRVSNSGTITTVAGNATSPPSLTSQPALPATLSGPNGIVCDYLGNIYFSEQQTGVVREIDSKGNLSLLIGNGSATSAPVASGPPLSYPLVQPTGLTTDGNYNIYIAEAGRISMYSPRNFNGDAAPAVQAIAATSPNSRVPAGTGDRAVHCLLAGRHESPKRRRRPPKRRNLRCGFPFDAGLPESRPQDIRQRHHSLRGRQSAHGSGR